MASGANGVGGVPGTIITGLRATTERLLPLFPLLLLLLTAAALQAGRGGSKGEMNITSSSWCPCRSCRCRCSCRAPSSSESERMIITGCMAGRATARPESNFELDIKCARSQAEDVKIRDKNDVRHSKKQKRGVVSN
jgi:hypothetical protein